jgi:hypothetical protein
MKAVGDERGRERVLRKPRATLSFYNVIIYCHWLSFFRDLRSNIAVALLSFSVKQQHRPWLSCASPARIGLWWRSTEVATPLPRWVSSVAPASAQAWVDARQVSDQTAVQTPSVQNRTSNGHHTAPRWETGNGFIGIILPYNHDLSR